ncbi:cytochrome P450 [Caulobacter sp. DWR1-3-2b1]|uniref:cytochrome P450 n=1 Tax=Caulobacter sp. DWR1-3-2b1 TaxID=2804670 RepID=UPI003CE830FE
MDALTAPSPLIVPPAPKVHARPIGNLRAIWEMSRSLVGSWSEADFDDLLTPYVFLGQPGLVVSDPAGVRHVMGSHAHNYRRPGKSARPIRALVGGGLLLTEGETWRRQRKSLAPAFTPAAIGALLPHFTAAGAALADRLTGCDRANLAEAFHQTALDAVLRALFSRNADADGAEMARLARRYLEGPAHLNLFDFLAKGADDLAMGDTARRRIGGQWFAAVEALIAERHANPRPDCHDLLGRLLAARNEDGAPLGDAEIRDQCGTMLAAGFETTSRLLFWTAYLLTLDTATQDRVRAEIVAFPPERVTSLDDLKAWPLMRSVLMEALRLYPPVPLIAREVVTADEILGCRVEPGHMIMISPWLIHRHRKLWDQPLAFQPERFIDQPHPWGIDAFIPFGAGPRVCIGASFALAEAQIILASLLERFNIALPAGARPVLPKAGISLAADHEPNFDLTPIA